MNAKELGSILNQMYNQAKSGEKAVQIHLFGIKYGEQMLREHIKAKEVLEASGITQSYLPEIQKGINIGQALKKENLQQPNEYIKQENITYWFAGANYDGDDLIQDFIKNSIYAIGWVHRDLKDIINDSDKMQEMCDDEELESSGVTAFERLLEIKKGDMIALKKSYTEGEKHSKSVLEVNAIGIVLEDSTTGYKFDPIYRHTIPVKWVKVEKVKTKGGYWGTLTPCRDKDKIKEVFGDVEMNEENIINGVVENNLNMVRSRLFKIDDLGKIQDYIIRQGLTYSDTTLSNFYLSLKSKPFTILAGISGTGKSKLVRLFSEAIGANFTLIPVKPDWSDATDLLGYRDLNQNFHPGRFTQVIEEAEQHLDTPYIICLDEMNLARVEYYFSDFLSLIESRAWVEGQIVTDEFSNLGDRVYRIPENVYVVGTVNMDETTFQFSNKVLDRANTIELSEVDLTYDFEDILAEEVDEEIEIVPLHNEVLKSKYLLLKECAAYKEVATRAIEKLIQINEILKPCGLEFAYRVRDEVVFYMVYNAEYKLLTEEEAFDFQMLQKVLPRMSGTSGELRAVLVALLDFCSGGKFGVEAISEMMAYGEVIEAAIYPRSAKKLGQMLRGYDVDGFTSFW